MSKCCSHACARSPTARCCKTADPERTLRGLLEERSPTYALADITVNRVTGRMTLVVEVALARLAAALCGAPQQGRRERRKVEVPLGARAYSILIGPGLIDEAGAEIAKIAPGRQMRDRHRRPCRAALSRPLTASLDEAGLRSDSHRLPPGEATKSYAEFARVSRRPDRSANRAPRPRHRAWRRRHWRPGRLLRRVAPARRALSSRFRRRCSPRSIRASAARPASTRRMARIWSARSTSRRWCSPIPPALDTLSEREFRAGYAEVVKYGLIGDRLSSSFWKPTGATFSPAAQRGRGDRHELRAPRPASSSPTRPSRASARCSISATPSATPRAPDALRFGAPRAWRGRRDRHGRRLPLFRRLGLCSGQDAARVEAHLQAVGLPTRIRDIPGPRCAGRRQIIAAMRQDKKVERGRADLHPRAGNRRELHRREVEDGESPGLPRRGTRSVPAPD